MQHWLPPDNTLGITELAVMQAYWKIDEASLDAWRTLVDENKSKKLVQKRLQRNVRRKVIDLSKPTLWRVMVGCQVTTLQRSSPGTKVGVFMDEERVDPSPALHYETCRRQARLQSFLESELRDAGLWRAKPISENLTEAMQQLEGGGWKSLLVHLSTLKKNTTKSKERKVVDYLRSGIFPGMGPKQSRNFIQWLGLARYEIPIDSRVVKALHNQGANLVPNATALGDENVYVFVQDALQEIARQLDIFPCILDASIFSSFDPE